MVHKSILPAAFILMVTGFSGGFGYGQSASAPGRVSGKVNDDQGGVAGNATVTLRSTGATKSETFSTTTGKDGTYLFTNIPAGTYTVCVQADSLASHLNPCIWSSDKPTIVTVAPATLSVVANPTVEKGVLLRVRINDPNKALVRKTPTSPILIVGVWNAQHVFYPLSQVSSDAGGASYQANVPYSTDLKVSLHGPAIQMQVDKTTSFSGSSTALPVKIDRGASAKDIIIDVLGPAK